MTERFKKAYDALVTAFFEGRLNKWDCAACAVGSIIHGCLGAEEADWAAPVYIKGGVKYNVPWGSYSASSGVVNIDVVQLTGYAKKEIAKIEEVFMRYCEGLSLEDQYKGLCAVVDVLMELDNMTPDVSYKNKFREHPALVNA